MKINNQTIQDTKMAKMLKKIGDLLLAFKYRTRVTPSLLGKTITIYANGNVFVVNRQGIQVRANASQVSITHLPEGKFAPVEININAGDECAAKGLTRRVYLASSPLHWRLFRVGLVVVLLSTLLNGFSDPTSAEAPALPSLAPQVVPQLPVAPYPVSAADEMGLPPAPFID